MSVTVMEEEEEGRWTVLRDFNWQLSKSPDSRQIVSLPLSRGVCRSLSDQGIKSEKH